MELPLKRLLELGKGGWEKMEKLVHLSISRWKPVDGNQLYCTKSHQTSGDFVAVPQALHQISVRIWGWSFLELKTVVDR